ncbi:MAG: S46 family peptidase [Nannocystis sp.]|uniref:S46 family peptidase n=1 Tax=Nannocystis sp. TaxID=1962667 RepID=UPI002427F2B6|nr:S46 family peptidase [Nannocystis sp.]MBK9754661.1 S46 family peptidase [Nannocystis sp.]
MPRFALLSRTLVLAGTAVVVVPAGSVRADEGQWMPSQIAELDQVRLRELGLELAPEQLWSEGGGLMRAAVNLSGCSAAFISADGLIATNHHCAYGAIQANSSVEHDYLKDGFVARSREQELPGKDLSVRVLEGIDDVTARVQAAADAAPDDRARAQAIDRTRKQIVDECEKAGPQLRCEVATFYSGSQYQRFTYREFRDVRLVYAPPAAIGEFGGEVDNWMWPRHTGDFSLLRAYAGADNQPAEQGASNVPYRPVQWLRPAHTGVKPGDFVAVLGYPGSTQRYLPVVETERYIDQVFPARIDLYGEWIAIFEALGGRDPALGIKVAASKKSLANRHKNAEGMIAGLRAMKLVERRKLEEAALEQWAARPENAGFADVLPEIRAISQERRDGFAAEFLLDSLGNAGNLLGVAIDVVRRAREAKKPDLERVSGFMDRDAKRLRDRVERRLRDFDPEVDAQLLAALLVRAAAVPEAARIAALAPLLADASGPLTQRDAFVPGLRRRISGSRLADREVALALLAADEETLARSNDPIVVLARALVLEVEAYEARGEARVGRGARVGPRYFTMLRTVRQGPVYPDANGTLRFSYATIGGYSPREALVAAPQTTLTGQLAKLTGSSPFTLPERVLAQAGSAAQSYWSDPALGDLPINFLANGDTTGGNSGSPVINGRGELVGLNFDRVWENIAGDFGYNPARSRNVIVDLRYMLWLLDRVEDAGPLLAELGVAGLRDAGPRPQQAAPDAAGVPVAPAAPAGGRPAAEDCRERRACGCSGGEAASGGALALLALLLRRKRRSAA